MYHDDMAAPRTQNSQSVQGRSYDLNCPIARSLDIIGDRWTLLILRDLFIFPSRRYLELRASLDGISPTLLSTRLKDLVAHGLIEQCETDGSHHLSYTLTERGRRTKQILVALAQFGLPLIDGRVNDKAWQAFTV